MGLRLLFDDKKTEFGRTINVVERFNVFQEIALAKIYLNSDYIRTNMHPMVFYVQVIFALQALLAFSLIAITYEVSKSFVG